MRCPSLQYDQIRLSPYTVKTGAAVGLAEESLLECVACVCTVPEEQKPPASSLARAFNGPARKWNQGLNRRYLVTFQVRTFLRRATWQLKRCRLAGARRGEENGSTRVKR